MPIESLDLPTPEAVAEALAPDVDQDLAQLTPEEARLVSRILPALEARARIAAEAQKGKELAQIVEELKRDNQALIEAELAKIRKAAEPPKPEELQKLLSQEYQEYTVQVRERANKYQPRDFIIRELPQATELKFVRLIQKSLVPRLKEFQTVEWTEGMTTVQKLQKVVDLIPDGLELMSDLCAISLDPFETEGITKAWVQANLSSVRIMAIIDAQVAAARMRDFMLAVSRLLPQ